MTDLLGIIPKWAKLNVNSSRDAWKQMKLANSRIVGRWPAMATCCASWWGPNYRANYSPVEMVGWLMSRTLHWRQGNHFFGLVYGTNIQIWHEKHVVGAGMTVFRNRSAVLQGCQLIKRCC